MKKPLAKLLLSGFNNWGSTILQLCVRNCFSLSLLVVMACQSVQNRAIVTSEPKTAQLDPAFVAQLRIGTRLTLKAAAPLRGGPTRQDLIRESIPQGDAVIIFETALPDNDYVEVSHHGLSGWVLGVVLEIATDNEIAPPATDPAQTPPVTNPAQPPPQTAPTSQQLALSRALTGVGFSYWWGGGAWLSAGATSQSAGTCTGNCPSCTHDGTYGADCSGYVAKVWQVPATNIDLSNDSHPYSTYTFNTTSLEWATVDRSQVKAADAYVYNANGEGHMFLYSSGDAFGSAYTYEARGCATGIVYNLRTIPSAYKPIRRAGW